MLHCSHKRKRNNLVSCVHCYYQSSINERNDGATKTNGFISFLAIHVNSKFDNVVPMCVSVYRVNTITDVYVV